MWKKQLLAGAITILCSVPVAHAVSSNEFLDMSLEELVDYRLMSMSRKEQRVADMAAAAYVISAEDIRRTGVQSVPEALRLVPGLNVAQISRNRWAVSSRGFNERFSSKLLVLVDGRSIYSPLFSGVLWETQDTVIEDIERIEVIRGPGAALWGTNAMNGVINIVTRAAASSQGSLISTVVGSGELATVSMRHGGELVQGGAYKVYGKFNTMGASVERDSGLMGDDRARQARLGVRIEPQIDGGGRLSIKAEAYRDRSWDVWSTPAVLAYSDPGHPYSRDSLLMAQDEGGSVQARLAWLGQAGQENVLQAFVDHERAMHTGLWGSGTGSQRPLAQAPQVTAFGGDKTDLDVDFQQRRLMTGHDFIWGLNFRHTTDNLVLPSAPYMLLDGRSRRMGYSAFVHDEIQWVPDRWRLILGSKFEKDSLTGFNVQPNARVLYTPDPAQAYWAALSRSVRSPRRTESLATLDISTFDAAQLNPQTGLNLPANALTAVSQISPLQQKSLQAERALSLEGGWRRQMSNALSLDAAWFVTDYSHLRAARQSAVPLSGLGDALTCLSSHGPGQCYFIVGGYNSNMEKARSWGTELAADWYPRAWWKVQAAYSYLKVVGQRTGDALADFQISAFERSAPKHQISLQNDFRLAQDLRLNVRLRYNSSTAHYTVNNAEMTRLPSYVGLDARLGWQWSRQTELSLSGRNLLKDRHTEFINILPFTRAYDVQRSVLAQAVIRF